MRHFKDPRFKPLYDALPARVRTAADRSFALLKQDPKHPSLHLWSARVGRGYRALAMEVKYGFHWFWIGSHAEYDRLVG